MFVRAPSRYLREELFTVIPREVRDLHFLSL